MTTDTDRTDTGDHAGADRPFPNGDPRGRDDGLGWVTRAVFPDPRVRLTVGRVARGGTHRVVARYAVVPSVARARFLLTEHVAGLIDPDVELHAALGVRPPDPNHKPTLQVFDGAGRPRGYAKIGWNDATRALVRAETEALRELALARSAGSAELSAAMVVPRLRAASEWQGLAIAVVEPLPTGVRGIDPAEPPAVDAMIALARSAPGGTTTMPFGDSPFAERLLREAGASGFSGSVRVATALSERDRGTVLEFGGWHGDWVPWNLGRDPAGPGRGGQLVVWDWEHRGQGVPIGFDLVHQGFQSALTLEGRDAAGAVAAAEGLLERYPLGLGRVERRLVVDAYLVELWLRTWRLAEGGGGWNGALHPALLEVLGRRL
jgi:hypothetical protein